MNDIPTNVDVVIIGAGPSGSISAGLLVRKSCQVLVLEEPSGFPVRRANLNAM